jgi:hypothetical protein
MTQPDPSNRPGRSGTPAWCQALDRLDDRQLGLLVQAAAAVLAGAGDGDDLRQATELPAGALAADLGGALAEQGVAADEGAVRRLVEAGERDRQLGIALLRQVCAVPALRAEVDAAYAARQRMMVVDPGTVLAAAVLLLVLKLRRVKVGREGVEVTLDPVRQGMLGFVQQLLRP